MSAPFVYDHDAVENLSVIKNLLEQGWPLTNPRLGAPFGSQFYDFPVVAGDALHLSIMWLIGLFTSNPAVVANIFFLLSFPVTALTSLWVFRRLGLSTTVAVFCAVLYALAPYHFFRGELHLFLQGYYGLPFGIYIAVKTLTGQSLRRLHRPLVIVLLCLVAATTDVYFAAFSLVLIGLATAAAAADPARRAAVRSGVAALALIGVFTLVQHLPSIVYQAEHGKDVAVAALRYPNQSEVFGMKLVRLLLPVDGHRVRPLADLTAHYVRESPTQLVEEPPQALGVVASAGFLFLLAYSLLAAAGVRRRARDETTVLGAVGALTTAAVIIAVAGGLSLVVAYFVSDSIRSWNRMSIVIAFFGLFAIGTLLDGLRPRIESRARGAVPWLGLLVVVGVLAALDQAPASIVPAYDATARVWQADNAYFSDLERRLPKGAMVYETPYFPYPERGYDEARPYIHTKALRFSFGAIEGRPADWAGALAGQPGGLIVPSVAAAGFAGVLVFPSFYPDGGQAADQDLRRVASATPIQSPDGNYRFYDLRPFAAREARLLSAQDLAVLRNRTLHPIRVVFSPSFAAAEFQKGVLALANIRFTDRPRGSLQLVNPSPFPRKVSFQAVVVNEESTRIHAFVSWPGSGVKSYALKSNDGTPIDRTVVVPPGGLTVDITTDERVEPSIKRYFSIRDVAIVDTKAAALSNRVVSAIAGQP